jgi:hypothetical protein
VKRRFEICLFEGRQQGKPYRGEEHKVGWYWKIFKVQNDKRTVVDKGWSETFHASTQEAVDGYNAAGDESPTST